jgi:hypothetical protein
VAPAWRIREFGIRMKIDGRVWWALPEENWVLITDGKESAG